MKSNIIDFRARLRSTEFTVANVLAQAKAYHKGAEVLMVIDPTHPKFSETRLKILGAMYWGERA